MSYEVPDPIINSPYDEPREHWRIVEGEPARREPRRRKAMYFYRDPKFEHGKPTPGGSAIGIELMRVNHIRERVGAWRAQGYPGVTRTTHELIQWWRRDGRERRLFFAQLEAAETVIFLREARADFQQGIDIPRDDPSDEQKAKGYSGFLRYACKMATGTGKTTVMGMIAAWSILNKVNARTDSRFSDVVLVVCPNVTIRDRLRELDPEMGEASLYRTRDLVPPHLLPLLNQGRVIVTNWHVFELRTPDAGGITAKVIKAGVREEVRERIHIGAQNTTARGKKYLSPATYEALIAAGRIEPVEGTEKIDEAGNLVSVETRSVRYVESDASLVQRVIGREVGGKQNILVLNDEAHHAYRIRRDADDEDEGDLFGEDEEAEEFYKEATVWVEGLDRIHRLRGINLCVDLSATPYFLGRVGQAANHPFPWVVSDFGLIDAIESGLVKIPQLAVRDTTGAAIPGYFNIWNWILPQLSPAERGAKKSSPKPEAILKFAHTPIAMLGGLWEKERERWMQNEGERRQPVFIFICKNTQIAKVLYEWLAEDKCPGGIPPSKIDGFRNRDGRGNTIRVDSKVIHETDAGGAKADESRWMRFTLDTVGKHDWPADRQGRPVYPEGFAELAEKLQRPLHPPGRDVRCIVSVGMLTEGWDCNTVTHIVGLRPFMSQLLCEQVVGRGLRRADYEVGDNGLLREEVAKVFGVPFEVVPFKANPQGAAPPPAKRFHIRAVPEKAAFEITFPRVEGYTQAIRNRLCVRWDSVPSLPLEPGRIPPEVEMKGFAVAEGGGVTLDGPGRIDEVNLHEFRSARRLQELVFDFARALTRELRLSGICELSAHVVFPQCVEIVERYLLEKVEVHPPADRKDLFLAPYYGWLLERLRENIHGDVEAGDLPELPRYETTRSPGSTKDVSFWTAREVRGCRRSHLNLIVCDTAKWEQSTAYYLDKHPLVEAFARNAGLGLTIPYLHDGEAHDYVPDFVARIRSGESIVNLIVETKGYDPLAETKRAAAERWVAAVNADGKHGNWKYLLVRKPTDIWGWLEELRLRPERVRA